LPLILPALPEFLSDFGRATAGNCCISAPGGASQSITIITALIISVEIFHVQINIVIAIKVDNRLLTAVAGAQCGNIALKIPPPTTTAVMTSSLMLNRWKCAIWQRRLGPPTSLDASPM